MRRARQLAAPGGAVIAAWMALMTAPSQAACTSYSGTYTWYLAAEDLPNNVVDGSAWVTALQDAAALWADPLVAIGVATTPTYGGVQTVDMTPNAFKGDIAVDVVVLNDVGWTALQTTIGFPVDTVAYVGRAENDQTTDADPTNDGVCIPTARMYLKASAPWADIAPSLLAAPIGTPGVFP